MKNRILLGLILLASGFGFAQSSGGGFTQFSKLRITTNPTDNPFRGKLLVRDTVTGNIDKIQFSDLPLNFTLTTADSSGVATLSAGNLNIPNYGLNSIPYTGTPSGKNVSGDIVSDAKMIFKDLDNNYNTYFGYFETTDWTGLIRDDPDGNYSAFLPQVNPSIQKFYDFGAKQNRFTITEDYFVVQGDSGNADFKGIVGSIFFNKQNDPNALAQLGDVQNATGFASYTDTAYTVGSPLTLLAGVDTVLPNNSGVIYDDEKPDDIATFYNGTTITGRDGDGLAIMIYFKATPSTSNSELDIWIDIGGGIGELYRQTVYFRGATKKGVLYALPVGYTRATWESNGGTVYVKSSVNMTVYGMNFNILRTHKSKN